MSVRGHLFSGDVVIEFVELVNNFIMPLTQFHEPRIIPSCKQRITVSE